MITIDGQVYRNGLSASMALKGLYHRGRDNPVIAIPAPTDGLRAQLDEMIQEYESPRGTLRCQTINGRNALRALRVLRAACE